MARRKSSAALFEVMSKSTKRSDAGGSLLSSVKGWLGSSRGGGPDAPAPVELPPPAVMSEPQAPTIHRELVSEPRYLQVRLSYTAAAICVLSVATTVALAYLAGRQSVPGQRPILATNSTEQLKEQPPLITVVDIGDSQARPEPPVIAPPGGGSGNLPVVSKNRVAGLNYLIVQGYPDESMAKAAQAVLAENGIETTIERKLPGWSTPAQWYSVVGVHGFAKLSNSPEYDTYLAKVKRVSEQYARPRSFKAFSPQAYKWQK